MADVAHGELPEFDAEMMAEPVCTTVMHWELGGDRDLFHLAQQLVNSRGPKPRLQWCGVDDYLYEDNVTPATGRNPLTVLLLMRRGVRVVAVGYGISEHALDWMQLRPLPDAVP